MKEDVISYVDFVPKLLLSVSELQSLYDDHIEFCDELLNHVFLGEITRFLVDLYDVNDFSTIAKILEFMDKAYSLGDEMTVELICVSFLENLQGLKNYNLIKNDLSPALKREIVNFE